MKSEKFRAILANPRVIAVIVAILLSLYFIGIPFSLFREGVVVRGVEKGSAAYDAGMRSSEEKSLGAKERIISVDSQPIRNVAEYGQAVSGISLNQTVLVETDKAVYRLVSKPRLVTRVLPELEENVVPVNDTANVTVTVNKTVQDAVGVDDLGIKVASVPKTNLRLGLDLQGGSRVLLKPETKLGKADLELLMQNINRRLNIFGLSDVVVRDASDLGGNQLIMAEIAGVNEEEVRDLIAKQGKFEAKISNRTVFTGSELTDVCRSAQCSGLDPNFGCRQSSTDWVCSFYFTITLSKEAAARQAAATANLAVINDYLSQPLQLFLDDELVDELQIGKELRGNPVTSVRISGSGTGTSRDGAANSAISNMKRLQTILITGSLPVKLEVVRTDSISPVLGEQFLKNALKAGLIAILFVVAVLSIAYRKFSLAIPIMLTSLLEILILLGFAALPFLGWTIDLAAVAGIIATVGTGVNDQIVITDEALKGERRRIISWKEKFKSAFAIIFGAYFTVLVAMLPLFVVGAGMLRGFALTTIIGMSVGVFITRPAYAKIIEILMEKD